MSSKTCSQCGEENSPSFLFCYKCKAGLASTPNSETHRMISADSFSDEVARALFADFQKKNKELSVVFFNPLIDQKILAGRLMILKQKAHNLTAWMLLHALRHGWLNWRNGVLYKPKAMDLVFEKFVRIRVEDVLQESVRQSNIDLDGDTIKKMFLKDYEFFEAVHSNFIANSKNSKDLEVYGAELSKYVFENEISPLIGSVHIVSYVVDFISKIPVMFRGVNSLIIFREDGVFFPKEYNSVFQLVEGSLSDSSCSYVSAPDQVKEKIIDSVNSRRGFIEKLLCNDGAKSAYDWLTASQRQIVFVGSILWGVGIFIGDASSFNVAIGVVVLGGIASYYLRYKLFEDIFWITAIVVVGIYLLATKND